MNSSRPSDHAVERGREAARPAAAAVLAASGLGGGEAMPLDELLVERADAAQVVADHGDAGGVDLFELSPAGQLDLAVDARARARGWPPSR